MPVQLGHVPGSKCAQEWEIPYPDAADCVDLSLSDYRILHCVRIAIGKQ